MREISGIGCGVTGRLGGGNVRLGAQKKEAPDVNGEPAGRFFAYFCHARPAGLNPGARYGFLFSLRMSWGQ